MAGGFVVALALLGSFALIGEIYGLPADSIATTTVGATITPTSAAPITATTSSPKEVKEPKDIKESATASKYVKDAIKAAREGKRMKKDCVKDCTGEYDPICVHDPNDPKFKPRAFGSPCAVEVHNCEFGAKLVIKSKGECPGSDGVRLS